MNFHIEYLILLVVLADSRNHGDNKDCYEGQDSSECDADNEVDSHSEQEADSSGVHIKCVHNHKPVICGRLPAKENFLVDYAGKQKEERSTTIAVIDSVGVSIEDQSNSSMEEDEDEAKTTLVNYPFSVSIQKKGAHYVSGALIDRKWILSVAGEFYHVRESLKLFRARLGSVDCKRGGSLVPIKRIEIHPYFIYGKPNFDVALLRIALPIKFSDVLRPIGISKVQGKVLSAKFMTTYWPRIVHKGETLPNTAKERIKYNSMRVSTQRLIPTNKCKNIMYAINEHINESSLCLKPVATHHSICMPDAGAPVVAEDGLWGITSGWIASTCPKFAAPTIFTRVSSASVRSWLDTQLRNNSVKQR